MQAALAQKGTHVSLRTVYRTMSDSRYNEREVDRILDIFLNRTYEANGRGGLFTIEDCPYDLRAVDIWYQMMWYLNTIL